MLVASFLMIFSLIFHSCDFTYTRPSENTQQEFTDPCVQLKCQEGQICVPLDDEKAVCLKKTNFEMKQIVKRNLPSYCGTNECRFGVCEVLNETSFVCHCAKGVTGPNCNELDKSGMPCSSSPCFGDSTCVNLADRFICVCAAGLTGTQCKEHISPCQCKNQGVCVSSTIGTYSCECRPGFGGHLCQYQVTPFLPCQVVGCFNEGTCALNGKCLCPPEFTGLRCESPNTTPIVTTKAETLKLNINVCYVGICQNGGTCYQLQPNMALCMCPKEYSGPYCEKYNIHLVSTPKTKELTSESTTSTTAPPTSQPTITSQVAETLPLLCSSISINPCQNNGVCVYSNQTRTFSCNCPPMYTDPLCTTRVPFCATSPCKNGGSCYPTDQYNGTCECATNYGGSTCEIILTCFPNPCKNNQPCLVIGGRARCFCTTNYEPPYCEKKSSSELE